MIHPIFKQIFERAAADAAFRELLLSDPDQALGQYPLSPAEVAAFKQLPREVHEKLSQDLGLLEGELSEEMLAGVSGASVNRTSLCGS
jgi:hypothetical protein